jgi:hypothetical protein
MDRMLQIHSEEGATSKQQRKMKNYEEYTRNETKEN